MTRVTENVLKKTLVFSIIISFVSSGTMQGHCWIMETPLEGFCCEWAERSVHFCPTIDHRGLINLSISGSHRAFWHWASLKHFEGGMDLITALRRHIKEVHIVNTMSLTTETFEPRRTCTKESGSTHFMTLFIQFHQHLCYNLLQVTVERWCTFVSLIRLHDILHRQARL